MVTGRTREIARVAEAFGTVQRTAVDTAVGEAELRKGINRVFINLSWRSQSLLHRQLRLLDSMERRASSSEELADLFRLDHLTTRMRRHAEGLVILSGSPTVRSWDRPVEAEDLLRAALAEVEDYTRVEVTVNSTAAIAGTVVADVIHLLAELIENAATFSPPATEVSLRAETVANGMAIDIVDRGIGLQPDQLVELNQRLSHAAEFDLADTDRLGLFVVARLAARHGIKVSLQSSPYGGTTAIVLVPNALVVVDAEREPGRRGQEVLVPGQQPAALGAVPGRPIRLDRPSLPSLPPLPVPPPMAGPPMAGPPMAGPPTAGPPVAGPPTYTPAAPLPAPLPNGEGPWAGEGPWSRDTDTGEFEAEPESSELTGRLPRRVRQQNLAPQLRATAEARKAAPAPQEDVDDFEEPTPELSRDLMSSLQSGWLRGREPGDDEDGADLDPRDERRDERGER
jgi:hypothetical protein